MIGFHFQRTVPAWPDAARQLPAGAWIKALDLPGLLTEAKQTNPGIKTVLRHWYDPGQQFDGGYAGNLKRARKFFASFINQDFRRNAANIDAVEEFNEYLANSQTPAEIQARLDWLQAVNDVWTKEYRSQPDLAHIRLVCCNTAVGNDIPLEFARIAAQHGAILGYHAYTTVDNGRIPPHDWPDFSGRWTRLDDAYRAQHIYVEWLFTEMGAYEGWNLRHVYNGNVDKYIQMFDYWLRRATAWNQQHDNRALGGVIFTTGAPRVWPQFELKQPDMNQIAAFVNQFMTSLPDILPPDFDGRLGLPREQYEREYWVVPASLPRSRQEELYRLAAQTNKTAGPSYDDAGIGALEKKTAVLWDIPPEKEAEFKEWYGRHYPGTKIIFRR